MDSGEVSAIVAVVGMALSYFGYNVDPALINGAIAGGIAIVTLGAALYSAYSHRQKNLAAAQ
jgi:Ni/Fe-hydrogenase subunit HybB-like protein